MLLTGPGKPSPSGEKKVEALPLKSSLSLNCLLWAWLVHSWTHTFLLAAFGSSVLASPSHRVLTGGGWLWGLP